MRSICGGTQDRFFCDQRDNRLRFSRLVKDARVLDLCCYTGGFGLAASVLGGAADVTGVDLDETAVAQARRNQNLNQVPRRACIGCMRRLRLCAAKCSRTGNSGCRRR